MKNKQKIDWTNLIRVIGSIIILILHYLGYRAVQPDEAKFLNIQKQEPRIEVHTSDSSNPTINAPAIQQQNQVKGNQSNEIVGRDKTINNITRTESSKKRSPAVQITGDNNNVNTGTNNGVIGNNNSITVPPKTLQPHPSELDIKEWLRRYPNKNTRYVFFHNNSDKLANNFTLEMLEKLKQLGYTNLGHIVSITNEFQGPQLTKGYNFSTNLPNDPNKEVDLILYLED